MNPLRIDGKPIREWLQKQPADLRHLLQRANLIAEINRALPSWSADPWIRQIHVANVREGTLVLHVESAAALVQLRYRQPALLAWVLDRFSLDCSRIEAKVRPPTRR